MRIASFNVENLFDRARALNQQLVLDATGMRVGELEQLTWRDIDEPRQRWRVSQAVAKTGRARWVPVADALFDALGGPLPP